MVPNREYLLELVRDRDWSEVNYCEEWEYQDQKQSIIKWRKVEVKPLVINKSFSRGINSSFYFPR